MFLIRRFARSSLALAIFLALVSVLRAASYTVSSTADDGSPGTLRWAITQANVNPGSTIDFASGLGSITLTSPLPLITTAMTLRGGPGATISGGGQYRIFFVAAGSSDQVVFENLTLANGYAKGGNGGFGGGGGGLGAGAGIFADQGNVTIRGVQFVGNAAAGGNGAAGYRTDMRYGGSGGGGGLNGDGGVALRDGAGGGGGLYGNGGEGSFDVGTGGGGGGVTGNGGNGFQGGGGGGGGVGDGGDGGPFPGPTAQGGAAGIGGGAAGGPSTDFQTLNPGGGGGSPLGAASGKQGGWGGGGGGGATTGGSSRAGGDGGRFGGGGGGSSVVAVGFSDGGDGGFGGGGGGGGQAITGSAEHATSYGGSGGFGGGGGGGGTSYFDPVGGTGGAFAGDAGNMTWGGGGGGAALGGAVFASPNATLTFEDVAADQGSLTGGAGGVNSISIGRSGTAGQTAGSAFFLSGPTTFSVSSGATRIIAGSIADASPVLDDPTAAGYQAATLIKSGVGTLVLSGHNTYGGGTSLEAGVLELGSAGAIGTQGAISFHGGVLRYSASNNTDYSARFSQDAGQVFAIDTNGRNVTFAQALVSPGGGLQKLGSGTLTLTQAASFSGTTSVAGGTLRLSGNGSLPGESSLDISGSGASFDLNGGIVFLGSLSGVTGGVVQLGSGTLAVGFGSADSTFAGSINDGGLGGQVIKTGFGTLTLTGSSSYRGGTLVGAGRLVVGHTAALGTGELTLSDAALQNSTDLFLANNIRITSAGADIDTSGGYLTLTGTLTGTGLLTKKGGNYLTLTGAQTHTGDIGIFGGILKVENGSLASSSVAISSGARLLFSVNGGYANAITGAGMLRREGAGVTILAGAASHTGGTFIDSGTLQIGNGGTTGSLAGTVTNNGVLVFNRGNALVHAGNILAGADRGGAVEQRGTGLLTLSGSNSYRDGTTIFSGTLRANNNHAVGTGAVVVEGGVFLVEAGVGLDNEIVLSGGGYQRNFSGNLAGAIDVGSSLGGVDTTAQTLAGTTGATRLDAVFSRVSGNGALRSDVFSLAGTGTNAFVLQLTIGSVESDYFLGWLDEETNLWVNAVEGNQGNNAQVWQQGFAGSFAEFQAQPGVGTDLSSYIGAWGRTGDSVWAVLNHNSDFAVVPEPSALAFLGLSLLFLAARRKNA